MLLLLYIIECLHDSSSQFSLTLHQGRKVYESQTTLFIVYLFIHHMLYRIHSKQHLCFLMPCLFPVFARVVLRLHLLKYLFYCENNLCFPTFLKLLQFHRFYMEKFMFFFVYLLTSENFHVLSYQVYFWSQGQTRTML